MQTLEQRFVFRSNMYRLREERDMSPTVFSNMVSNLLYEKRFGPYFCEPVICGLQGPENKPYLCGMDLLGAQVYTDDFFEVLAQCLASGVDRDCLAGWGCTVHILTPEGLTITLPLRPLRGGVRMPGTYAEAWAAGGLGR